MNYKATEVKLKIYAPKIFDKLKYKDRNLFDLSESFNLKKNI